MLDNKIPVLGGAMIVIFGLDRISPTGHNKNTKAKDARWIDCA